MSRTLLRHLVLNWRLVTLMLVCLIGLAMAQPGFTVAAGTDLALNKTATASSEYQPAALAVDGNVSTQWWSAGGTSSLGPQWLEVDLGATYTVAEVQVLWDALDFGVDYGVETKVDVGDAYTTQITVTAASSGGQKTHTFAAVSARYVRLYVTLSYSAGINWLQVYDFNVYSSGTPSNTAPTAVDDTASTNEDTPVSISVLANDSDPDSDPLSIAALGSPAHGNVIISGTTQLVYTPTLNFNGTEVFTYSANDGALSAVATITVTVNPINDAPTAVGDSVATNEDTPVVISPLSNDTDVEGNVLALGTLGLPSHGTASISGTQIIYTPTLNFNGTDNFNYVMNDGLLNALAAITVTITPVNDGPTAVGDSVSTAEDTPVVISPLSNDTDVEGDTLSLGTLGLPSHGTASISG
nr:tandem-95 repeat protein [Thermoflexales bacterium]